MISFEGLDHVQITVERSCEGETLVFYRKVLKLQEIEKPEALRKNGGAWFKIGATELHISPEDISLGNVASKRHICLLTNDLMTVRSSLAAGGVKIIEDKQPIEGWERFYMRDPGGNRIEIAKKLPS